MLRSDIYETIDNLSNASTLECVNTTINYLKGELGFDNYAYGGLYPSSIAEPRVVILNGYPQEWYERYVTQEYIGIDPTISHCAKQTTHVLWEDLRPLEREDKQIKSFMDESRDFGLKSGLSVPVHGVQGEFANLSFSSNKDTLKSRNIFRYSLPYLSLITPHIHESVRRIENANIDNNQFIALSDRERQCLLWAAEGKTSWETSIILGIAERTVIFHLQNAASKLRSTNRIQAVARAISLRLITPLF